jgi:hypothetical protein
MRAPEISFTARGSRVRRGHQEGEQEHEGVGHGEDAHVAEQAIDELVEAALCPLANPLQRRLQAIEAVRAGDRPRTSSTGAVAAVVLAQRRQQQGHGLGMLRFQEAPVLRRLRLQPLGQALERARRSQGRVLAGHLGLQALDQVLLGLPLEEAGPRERGHHHRQEQQEPGRRDRPQGRAHLTARRS